MIRDRLKKLLGREKKPAATPAAPAPKPAAPPTGNLAGDKDRPWYLDGQADVEGWDATDVKKG